MANFNLVDVIIMAILFLSLLMGFMRGLLREILSLLTWVAAFVIATLFATRVAAMFFSSPESSQNASQATSLLHTGISFIGLFIVTLFIGWIISFIIGALTGKMEIGFFNRFMGGLFGLGRGFLIVLAGIFLIELTSWAEHPRWQESKLVLCYQPMVDWIDERVQPEFKNLKEKLRSESVEPNRE